MTTFLKDKISEHLHDPQLILLRIALFLFMSIALSLFPTFLLIRYMFEQNLFAYGLMINDALIGYLGYTSIIATLFLSIFLTGSLPFIVAFRKTDKKAGQKLSIPKAMVKVFPLLLVNIVCLAFTIGLSLISDDKQSIERAVWIIGMTLFAPFALFGFFLFNTKTHATYIGMTVLIFYICALTCPSAIINGTMKNLGLGNVPIAIQETKGEAIHAGTLVLLTPTEMFYTYEDDDKLRVSLRETGQTIIYR